MMFILRVYVALHTNLHYLLDYRFLSILGDYRSLIDILNQIFEITKPSSLCLS